MFGIPLNINRLCEDLHHPHRLRNQHFGFGLNTEALLQLGMPRSHCRSKCPLMAYYRSRDSLPNDDSGISTVKTNKDQFQVMLDVQQFEPHEINVKVVDRHVIVEGKHEEKEDEHGMISRQFKRRFTIPEECNIDHISSKLFSDGILSISVPWKNKEAVNGERVIHIEHTGMPVVRNYHKTHETEKSEENGGN